MVYSNHLKTSWYLKLQLSTYPTEQFWRRERQKWGLQIETIPPKHESCNWYTDGGDALPTWSEAHCGEQQVVPPTEIPGLQDSCKGFCSRKNNHRSVERRLDLLLQWLSCVWCLMPQHSLVPRKQLENTINNKMQCQINDDTNAESTQIMYICV